MSIDIENSCFFTGHRIIPQADRERIKTRLRLECIKLIENYGVTHFIAGGALGFDTLAELMILDLKAAYPQIKLSLYLPCTDQTARWSQYDKRMWLYLNKAADDYQFITNGTYTDGCMQLRNRAMVDDARYGIAYCTQKRGGTYSCLSYALSKQRKVLLIK